MKKSIKIVLCGVAAVALVVITALITLAIVHKTQSKETSENISITETAQEEVSTPSEMAETDDEPTTNGEDYVTSVVYDPVSSTAVPETTPTVTTDKTTTTTKPVATTTSPTTTKPVTTAKPAKGTYTLSLSGDGGVADIQGAGTYRAGDAVTVSTTLLIGYTFRHWASSDTALLPNGTTQTYKFTMPSGNVSLKAITYIKPQVTVTAGTGVSSVSGSGSYAIGQSVTVTAVMKEGYEFAGWTSGTEGFGSNQISYTFTMPEQSVSLKATGTAKTFTLSVKAGTGISGVSGSGQYKVGDKFTVNATVQNNYVFSNWSGSGISGATKSSYTFTMPGKDVTLTANAKEAPKYTITVAKGENGITSVSGGGSYFAGTTVTVSCKVSTGYIFDKWYSSNKNLLTGGTSQSFTFTMPKGNLTLTARATKNQYTVTVSKGEGISAVSGGGNYAVGSKVTVNCQVANGYRFSRWASSNTELVKDGATQSYTFTMPKGNIKLTAKTYVNTYTITLSKGDGIESVSGAGKYVAGNSVTINCTPKAGYAFTEWTSNNTSKLKGSTAQTYSFTMPQANVTLTAKAVKNQYKLTVQKGTGISSVSGGGTYSVGDTVTVGCTPSTGYSFTKWSSSKTSLLPSSTSQSFSFNMPKGDVTLTAQAERYRYTVSITNGTGIQSVSGAGTYSPGDTVTVYADMYYGYVFDRWTSGGSTVSTSEVYTFTMPNKNVSLTAKARQDSDY